MVTTCIRVLLAPVLLVGLVVFDLAVLMLPRMLRNIWTSMKMVATWVHQPKMTLKDVALLMVQEDLEKLLKQMGGSK